MKFFGKIAIIAAGIGTLGALAASPAFAHHSFAMFDQTRKMARSQVTVAEFRFTNPHSFVVVNVTERGKVTRWVFECSSVNMMRRSGWNFNTIKAGDRVDITYYPLRNGNPGGMLDTIKVPDGRVLPSW